MKRKAKKQDCKPGRCRNADLLALHEALKPMADGCMATSARAYDLVRAHGFSDKGASTALDLTVETLGKINDLMDQASKKAHA